MEQKKFTIEPKTYTTILLYLFFDSLLSNSPTQMGTKKWHKATDSPLLFISNSRTIDSG